MKKRFLFVLALLLSMSMWLSSTSAAAAQTPDNVPQPQPETLKFGGFNQTAKANIITAFNAYGFDFKDNAALYLLGEPLSNPGSWGLVKEDQTLKIYAGAWTGTEWFVYTKIKPKTGAEFPGLYFAVEPISGKIRKIGSGNANKDIVPNCMTYNPSEKELFGIAGSSLYKMSLTDTTIKLIDTLRLEDGSIIKDGINVIASNSNGSIYAISVKNNVYKVNKNTGKSILIGNTNTKVGSNIVQNQSACFDYRTNRMYWAGYNPSEMYEIDTLSGAATSIIPSSSYVRTNALFVHYYTADCPPGDVEDLQISLDQNNTKKVNISAKAPTLNFNGEAQQNLAKAYLYRSIAGFKEDFKIIDSVNITSPGGAINFIVNEASEGIYIYGIKVKDNAGRFNLALVNSRVKCFNMTLPYQSGFETTDNNAAISVENAEGWVLVDSNAYAGNKCYYSFGPSSSYLQINGIPVKKGASYEVKLMLRGSTGQGKISVSSSYSLNNGNFKSAPIMSLPGDKYSSFAVPINMIEENGYLDYYIKGSYNKGIFVDNIQIRQVGTEKVPDTTILLDFYPAPLGENAAILKWKTPGVDASGAPLEDLGGIIVKRSTSSSFSAATTLTDTIFNFKKGEIDSAKVSVKNAGKWYFRMQAYNKNGLSPYIYTSKISAWIGMDTTPKYPANQLASPLADGKIKVTWDSVENIGNSGGYLNGEITGYRIDYFSHDNGPKEVKTEYTAKNEFITPSLPEASYIFRIMAVRNNLNLSSYVTAGSFARSGNTHVVLNANRKLGTPSGLSNMPFLTLDKNLVVSSICQSLYTKEEMGGPRVIDSLIYYISVPQEERIPIKIYMDYKVDTAMMVNNEDWVSFRQKTSALVFDDSIIFKPGMTRLAIPIKPWFYNGSAAMLSTLIKKKCYQNSEKGAISVYSSDFSEFNLNNGRVLFQTRKINDPTYNFVDYDTLADVSHILPYKAVMQSVPCLLITEPDAMGQINGSIKNKRSQKAISAQISISPVEAGKAVVDIEHTFSNDSANDGKFSFAKLVPNKYKVRVSSLGYIDSSFIVTIENKEIKSFNILLDEAQKINISGSIKDEAGKVLSEVPIKLSGIETYDIISDKDGAFLFDNLYNNTTYTISVNLFPYEEYSKEVVVLNDNVRDFELVLKYPASPISYLSTNKGKDSVALTWKQPYTHSINQEWKQWCNDSSFNAIGANSLHIMGACRFTPEDMKKMGIAGKKLKTIRFRLTEYQTDYTVRVFQGQNAEKEIWSKNLGPKNMPKWFDVELPALLDIDSTQDLYLAVEAAEGYMGFPIAVDEGPNNEHSKSMAYLNGIWSDIKQLSSSFDYHISIMGLFAEPVEIEPTEGYNVYRLSDKDKEYPERWTLLTSSPTRATSYIDEVWPQIPFGWYQYAVRANYGQGRLSSAVISNRLTKDLEFNVTVNVKGSAKNNAYICFLPKSGNLDHKYEKQIPLGSSASFAGVWRGEYEVGLRNSAYESSFKTVNITSDTTITFEETKEYISDPTIISCEAISEGRHKLTWSMTGKDGVFQDFENATDFSVSNVSPFIFSDPVKKGEVKNATWKNSKLNQSFIVFNPSETEPAMNTAPLWAPLSGSKKYLVAFYAIGQANDDWLILPVKSSGCFTFNASGIGLLGLPESIQIMYSTGGTSKKDFKPLTYPSIIAQGWKQYQYYLPKDAKAVALRYVSNNLYALLVDNVRFTPEGEGSPISYEVYLDGKAIGPVRNTLTNYTYKNLSEGKHLVGVKAIFNSGDSKLVQMEIMVTGNEEISMDNIVKVYPNPSSNGIYNVHLTQDRTLEVYTLMGEKILKKKLSAGEHLIDISSHGKGLYFFVLDNIYNVKVIKAN